MLMPGEIVVQQEAWDLVCKDAARYRWMRDKKNADRAEYFAGWFFDKHMDQAIDDAIRGGY